MASIWHRRLGRLNQASMKLLRHAFGLKFDDPGDYPCEICVKGKQTKQPCLNVKKDRRASKVLQLVHTNLCDLMENVSIGSSKYFMLFVDDYSRRLSIYFLKNKSEALETFKGYKAYVEKQAGRHLQALRSKNRREFVNEEFNQFFRREGIKHQLTVLYSPQQNGLAERCNRTVMKRARCTRMLLDANLPKRFWAEACSTAVYLINRSPAKSLQGRIPYELWTKKKLDLSLIRTFGCKALAYISKDFVGNGTRSQRTVCLLDIWNIRKVIVYSIQGRRKYLKAVMLFFLKTSRRMSKEMLVCLRLLINLRMLTIQ